MNLLETQSDADSLAKLGAEAVDLLCRGDIDTLAGRYGYALRFDRDPATAIREDLTRCLTELGAGSLTPAPEDVVRRVGFFEANDSSLLAVIECLAPTDNGARVLVELIVTTSGAERHITLEDLSAIGPAWVASDSRR